MSSGLPLKCHIAVPSRLLDSLEGRSGLSVMRWGCPGQHSRTRTPPLSFHILALATSSLPTRTRRLALASAHRSAAPPALGSLASPSTSSNVASPFVPRTNHHPQTKNRMPTGGPLAPRAASDHPAALLQALLRSNRASPGAACGTLVRGQHVEKHHGALLFLIHALPRLGIADGATSPWAAGGEETWGGTGNRWRRNLERNDIS
jgi:hypothetical protein